MAATTEERDTKRIGEGSFPSFGAYEVLAGEKIIQGTMVGMSSGGFAEDGDTSSAKVLGRARSTVDNTGGADGDEVVEVDYGIFRYANDGSNPVVAAQRWTSFVNLLDNQTIDNGSGGGPQCGKLAELNPRGLANTVDVLIHPALTA